MKFGFSTGALHQHMNAKQAIHLIREIGCNSVELGFIRMDRISKGWLDKITAEDLKGFEYVSFHAPKMEYRDDDETEIMFKKIEAVHAGRALDLVVFHPDNVKNINLFKKLSFPVAFENMDDQKPFGKTPDDLDELLRLDSRFRLVLDMNHVKTNDPSMKLATEFYKRFLGRVAEIHVSGIGDEYPHMPLFQTKEEEIVRAIANPTVPIICESRLSPEEIEQEKKYIEQILLSKD
jgi:hypothetical protein